MPDGQTLNLNSVILWSAGYLSVPVAAFSIGLEERQQDLTAAGGLVAPLGSPRRGSAQISLRYSGQWSRTANATKKLFTLDDRILAED